MRKATLKTILVFSKTGLWYMLELFQRIELFQRTSNKINQRNDLFLLPVIPDRTMVFENAKYLLRLFD